MSEDFFKKCINFFLTKGGTCLYIVPFKYKHYAKNWEPSTLPEVNTDFCIDGRWIDPSSRHGLGLFSMDGLNIPYKNMVDLMEYVGPMYEYNC